MLNEKLGRHRGMEGMKECDNHCGSVSHVLWECPAYTWKNMFIAY